MKTKVIFIYALLLVSSCEGPKKEFVYKTENLALYHDLIKDSLRQTEFKDIPVKASRKNLVKVDGTPVTKMLWKAALADVESNMVDTKNGRYFGAGKKFGVLIYTRDISFSGILALNQLYPTEMLSSLRVTRDVRLGLGLKVSQNYIIPEIHAPWEELEMNENEFLREYKTNSYTRRTDDVIWLWAAMDLFEKNPDMEDWEWLLDKGTQSFNMLYWPFFDKNDGLFRGQASFVDIHFQSEKATGYPQSFSITDCALVKALSTNCLYYKGMLAMAKASEKLGDSEQSNLWYDKAGTLKKAILKELRFEDGTFSYFKDKNGNLQERRDALGSSLLVLSGILSGKEAQMALADYPETWAGVPIFHPFYPWDTYYHNNTSWPFVDTFYLWAKEQAYQEDFRDYNAALLARTCFDDETFREVVNFKTKEPYRSVSQLWTAASYLNVCLRQSDVELDFVTP